jgi:hypothetical protein
MRKSLGEEEQQVKTLFLGLGRFPYGVDRSLPILDEQMGSVRELASADSRPKAHLPV